jgi:hypothetical protein
MIVRMGNFGSRHIQRQDRQLILFSTISLLMFSKKKGSLIFSSRVQGTTGEIWMNMIIVYFKRLRSCFKVYVEYYYTYLLIVSRTESFVEDATSLL